MAEPAPFEILEHTADVGLRARGRTMAEAFEHAADGMGAILGLAPSDAPPAEVRVSLRADDRAALLVEWLEELLFLAEARGVCVTRTEVREIDDTALEASAWVVPRADPGAPVAVKAATYHRLAVEPGPGGWIATVFFDV